MKRKTIIHVQGRRENVKSEQPHKHDRPNHISAQHIIYSLSYLQSISQIFSHNVHFTSNCHWLHGASCRLLKYYDAFWDKQASAIVFHIYNLTERGAELKQSFMRRKNVWFVKKRFRDRFVLRIIHSLWDERRTRWAQRKPSHMKRTPFTQAVHFSIMQNNSRTVMIAI